eukprot:m.128822 g.128822  ORF g.128822 m.128822 type:complete len:1848 (+) comp9760_c0_seq5:346-5889(+)
MIADCNPKKKCGGLSCSGGFGAFGAQKPGFGAPAGGGAFGAPGGAFGAPAATAAGGAFGAKPGGFGTPAGGSAFGAPSAFGTPGASTAGSAFGANPGAFGTSAASGSAFGAKPGGFGTPGTTAGSAFGAKPGGAFGAPGTSAFGSTSPGGAFGQPGGAFGAKPGGAFGSPATSAFGGGSAFGAPAAGGAFGAAPKPFGTPGASAFGGAGMAKPAFGTPGGFGGSPGAFGAAPGSAPSAFGSPGAFAKPGGFGTPGAFQTSPGGFQAQAPSPALLAQQQANAAAAQAAAQGIRVAPPAGIMAAAYGDQKYFRMSASEYEQLNRDPADKESGDGKKIAVSSQLKLRRRVQPRPVQYAPAEADEAADERAAGEKVELIPRKTVKKFVIRANPLRTPSWKRGQEDESATSPSGGNTAGSNHGASANAGGSNRATPSTAVNGTSPAAAASTGGDESAGGRGMSPVKRLYRPAPVRQNADGTSPAVSAHGTPVTGSSSNPPVRFTLKPGYQIFVAGRRVTTEELEDMSREELSRLAKFTIVNPRWGKVEWQGPTDISRGLDMDTVVTITKRSVDIYPSGYPQKPEVGYELNKPARVELYHVFPTDKTTKERITDKHRLLKYADKIKHTTEAADAKFISYDLETGTWIFEARHFSRVGVDSDVEDDDDDGDAPDLKARKATIGPDQTADGSLILPVPSVEDLKRRGEAQRRKSIAIPEHDDEDDEEMGDDEGDDETEETDEEEDGDEDDDDDEEEDEDESSSAQEFEDTDSVVSTSKGGLPKRFSADASFVELDGDSIAGLPSVLAQDDSLSWQRSSSMMAGSEQRQVSTDPRNQSSSTHQLVQGLGLTNTPFQVMKAALFMGGSQDDDDDDDDEERQHMLQQQQQLGPRLYGGKPYFDQAPPSSTSSFFARSGSGRPMSPLARSSLGAVPSPTKPSPSANKGPFGAGFPPRSMAPTSVAPAVVSTASALGTYGDATASSIGSAPLSPASSSRKAPLSSRYNLRIQMPTRTGQSLVVTSSSSASPQPKPAYPLATPEARRAFPLASSERLTVNPLTTPDIVSSTAVLSSAPSPVVSSATAGSVSAAVAAAPALPSITRDKSHFYSDAGLVLGRSFRVGWGPNGMLVLPGLVAKQMQQTRAAKSSARSGNPVESLMSLAGSQAQMTVASRSRINSVVALQQVRVAAHLDSAALEGSDLHPEPGASLSPPSMPQASALRDRFEAPLEADLRHSQLSWEDADGFAPRLYLPSVAAAIKVTKELEQAARTGANAIGVNPGPTEALAQRDLAHSASCWGLVDALWGTPGVSASAPVDEIASALSDFEALNDYEQQRVRRLAVSRWLASSSNFEMTSRATPADARNPDSESALAEIFNHLTVNNIAAACQTAARNRDFRLALLMSQATGPMRNRAYVVEQLELWRDSGARDFINRNRLKIYTLLAGRMAWPDVPEDLGHTVCEGLDWRRALSVHLWYACPATASVAQGVDLYDKAFRSTARREAAHLMPSTSDLSLAYAPAPLPPYVSATGANGADGTLPDDFDTRYHLLKLHCARSHSLETTLLPTTATASRLDFRLSWHLHNIVSSLGISRLPARREEQLHTDYAAQLEGVGLWHWAAFVLLHLEDPAMRTRAVRELLARNCGQAEAASSTGKRKIAFVLDQLSLPAAWTHQAASSAAKAKGKHRQLAKALIASGQWDGAHRVIVQQIAPKAIIQGKHARILRLLRQIEPHAKAIQGWEAAGEVYLKYLQILQMVRELSQTAAGDMPALPIVELREATRTLCMRIAHLPGNDLEQKFCRSEMATKMANLVLSLNSGGDNSEEGQWSLLGMLDRLPLAENYRLSHLVQLSESFGSCLHL